MDFEVSIRTEPGQISIGCSGEVDLDTIDPLKDAIDYTIERANGSRISVDFRSVSFFDGEGVRLLLETLKRCDASDIPLELMLSAPVSDVLERAGLTDLFGLPLEQGPPAAL